MRSGKPGRPRRLPPSFLEKPWGTRDLSPWYPPQEQKIGEVWFDADLPLLVKFIFTSGRLSVQVHPDNPFALEYENSRGKTEMWHIMRADQGAQVALGFRETIAPQRLKEAAQSGEIVDLLNWVDVRAGDTFFVPAGTVHAIGAGLALCELQQHSDITYRIYDYGSDRQLHLDKAMRVCDTSALDAKPVDLPVKSRYFQTEAMTVRGAHEFDPEPSRFELLVFLEGAGSLAGDLYQAGETWLIPAGSGPFRIEPGERTTKLLRAWVPRIA